MSSAYMCFTLLKLAYDFGIWPEILFWSTWSLFKLDKKPSSSGKAPDNLFPLKSLHPKYIIQAKAPEKVYTVDHLWILVL